jgi:rfaE bifunctional protein kinase chain/domain
MTPHPPERPTTERLLDLVDRMAGQPVAVLADLVVDRFITGTPKRISREAPVLILRHQGEHITPGGGANAIANVAALGGRPIALGLVGDDDNGRALLDDLEKRGVDTAGIRVRSGYRTPTKTRILGGAKGTIKQQIVRFDIEDTATPTADDRAAFVDTLRRAGGAAVAVASDYGYGAVDGDLLDLVAEGLDAPGQLLLDSRYRLGELGATHAVSGATPNEEEAETLFGGPLDGGATGADDLDAVHHSGSSLVERLDTRFLLVTRGSRGMALFAPGAPSAHLPVHGTDQVADVTGAGDTVIGTFALGLAAGASPLEAAALANYAGGVVVMKAGTATLGPNELAHAVSSDPTPLEELAWVGC